MNLPAEIINNAPQILEHGKDFLLSRVEGGFQDYLWKRIIRALARYLPLLKEADPRELEARLDRLESAMDGFSDEMRHLKAKGNHSAIAIEMREPAAQTFVSEALEAAMESPSEGKRALLGRLIARRLASSTESADELYLRQAFQIVERTNERQLHLLATILLIDSPPVPEQTLNRRELNQWFDVHLMPIIKITAAQDPVYRDLEYLTVIGAVTFSESQQEKAYSGMGGNADGLERTISQKTTEYAMPGRNTAGNFYRRASELVAGDHDKEQGIKRIALAPYSLTTSGWIVAQTIVDGLRTDLTP